jgi:outer membrane lipoprotein SlyB
MQKNLSLLIPLSIALVCAGCEGNGPNTQTGAVAGGALGALAGAIIGNNSGGHNGLAGALIGGTVGAIAGGALGNVEDHKNGTLYTSPDAATTTMVVQQAPPPPPPPSAPVVVESAPPGAVYIPGYYYFNGSGYVWVEAHWESPPPGCHYFYPPHWDYRPNRGAYVYVHGYWR